MKRSTVAFLVLIYLGVSVGIVIYLHNNLARQGAWEKNEKKVCLPICEKSASKC